MDTEINLIIDDTFVKHPLIKNIKYLSELNSLDQKYKTIYIGDTLNYIENPIDLLKKVKSKLIQNGKLIIEEYDQNELCCAITNSNIQSNDFNNIIKNKLNIFTLEDITNILIQSGFKILIKEIDNLKHLIEVE